MVEPKHPDTISVFVKYIPGDLATVASFTWPDNQPEDTYTIDVNRVLSIELDRHFPIRPAAIRRERRSEQVGEETILEDLVGKELTELIETAEEMAGSLGAGVMELGLSPANKIAFAKLQIRSPSTPPRLKRACHAKLDEIGSKEVAGGWFEIAAGD